MKSLICLQVILLFLFLSCNRDNPTDFKTINVNKKVKEFPDEADLSSPLKSAITINYLSVHGKKSMWRQISSEIIKPFFQDTTAGESNVTEMEKNKYLNTIIREIITYRDSRFQLPVLLVKSWILHTLSGCCTKSMAIGLTEEMIEEKAYRNLKSYSENTQIKTCRNLE